MEKKRFYYTRSTLYGWCVYDRETNIPAYEGCQDLLPPVSQDENGTITETPICDTEYQAMRLCCRLNVAYKRYLKNKD